VEDADGHAGNSKLLGQLARALLKITLDAAILAGAFGSWS